jgi:hypothetical protein
MREVLGKREIVIPLGRTPADAMKRYPAAHKEAEHVLRTGQLAPAPTALPLTEAELHAWAVSFVRGLDLDPDQVDVMMDHIAAKYPLDEEGHPVGVTDRDAAVARVLAYGEDRAPKPKTTLADARALYLREKGLVGDRRGEQRVDRAIAAIGKPSTTFDKLDRAKARETRDGLLDAGQKPATVHRTLNDIRAILNLAVREGLAPKDWVNPFTGLEVRDAQHSQDDRLPMPEDVLDHVTAGLRDGGKAPELAHIWHMLEGTGMRVDEVTGLAVSDVRLDHEIPHLVLQPHPWRGLKTAGSGPTDPLDGTRAGGRYGRYEGC